MSIKLLPVYLLHFINFFNLMLWGPILEPILQQQKVNDPRIILILNGLIIATYPLCQFFAIHPLNSLSDRIGKKKVLLFTQYGTVLSLIISILAISSVNLRTIPLLGVSLGLWLLIFSRVIDGISGGNAMVTNNYANDIINKENLDPSGAFTSIELSMMAGSLSGVFLGPIFASSRFGAVGALYLILSIALIGVYIINKRVKDIKNMEDKNISFQDLDFMHQLRKTKGYPIVQRTLVYRFVFQFIFISFITNIFIFLKNRLGIEGSEISMVMFVVSVITVLIVTVVNPKIIKKYGDEKSFEISKYFLLAGLLLFYLVPFVDDGFFVGAGLLSAYAVLGVGVTISLSLFKFFLTDSVEDEKQGHMIALEEQLIILTAIAGATVSGFVTAYFSAVNLPAQTLFLFFLILGVIYLTVSERIFVHKKKQK
jgi:MFS transporter, DHA1 family, tetracycline resistance protein